MKILIKIAAICLAPITIIAQDRSLVNTSASAHALLSSINMGDVQWTKGFWAERMAVCRDSMVPNMWKIYNDASVSHAFKNFEIAAGLDTGSHKGPSFHDGDFYKTLEALASMYAATKDPKLDAEMDKAIEVIRKAQREDGYIYTKAVIEQKKTGEKKQFEDRLSFEAYNIGHLMTAGCVHYRATGKKTLLDIAIKATDYLYLFYERATPEIARNAICPSHYMGIIEMYRTVKDPKYLALANKLIDIRGVSQGSDDNSDRYKFRDMKEVVGHAVRANYLFAGVADLYAETGDETLKATLDKMWKDVVNHKMYITGGCGALYDGVSNDGTSYNPNDVEKLHQAYGRAYQLPNLTAHNETCANIGNVLWNWRMLLVTGDAKYADIMELALYNSVLSGISLNGKNFLYTNPLSNSDELPFKQRWSKDRVPYISLSNCCPPNVVRTIAEISNYAYSVSDKGLWFNLYGGNHFSGQLKNGQSIKLKQETGYPWDGTVKITVQEPADASLFFRIPGWCRGAAISVNGTPVTMQLTRGGYAEINRNWKQNDVIELNLPMEATLIEANPLVEETRNLVAVKRGPVVYCIESVDYPKDESIFNIAVTPGMSFKTKMVKMANSDVLVLTATSKLLPGNKWKDDLYREVPAKAPKIVNIQLVPYYAWGNRGHSEMSVWMPVR